jgi:hypothetical protein
MVKEAVQNGAKFISKIEELIKVVLASKHEYFAFMNWLLKGNKSPLLKKFG